MNQFDNIQELFLPSQKINRIEFSDLSCLPNLKLLGK